MTKHIDTNLLQIGQEFKNYPHLCQTLDIEVAKGGRNSKLQKQDLKRYFDWEVDGRKITITEIYDTQKEKVDGRGKSENSRGNNIIYGNLLDEILIEVLSDCKNDTIHLTLNNIAIITNMINENYKIAISNRALFSKYAKDKLNIHNDSSIRNSFYNIRNIIRPAINSSIRRLTRKGYIESRYGYIVASKSTANNQKENNIILTRMANQEELKEIGKIEKQILVEYKVSSIKELNSELLKNYYDKVNVKIKSIYPDIDKVFKGYEITAFYAMNQIEINHDSIEASKQKLNELILNKIKTRFQKDVQAITSRIELDRIRTGYFGTRPIIYLKKHEIEITQDSYIIDGETISNLLVSLDVEKILTNNYKH